ncbi:carbohydrate ABC transporter permease [Tuberibacillus sp. Marseille-P3662]|uniref:carbohydrate ABC transporter permease n=1 Tax=Tuberibacillus sp. Marseille-P3662 TaxID=1965358 RepID=UPI000A1CD6FE|nr:sugar ABC transporter permease [Tuberibacillus sp. Marseille-P3662]
MRNDNKPPKKRKIGGSDRNAAWLLIAPSLILILAISIYPVLQSFYFSLFDLQLNTPTKSSTHLKYNIQLDQYLKYYPFLEDELTNEISEVDEPLKGKLTDIKKDLTALNKQIRDDSEGAYEKVNQTLNNYETPSQELATVEISNEMANQFTQRIASINKRLTGIENREALSNAKELIGLADGLRGAVIEPNFIGFEHYANQLTNPRMWSSLWNTVVFTVLSVFFEFVLGFAIALLINKVFIGRGMVRATVLIPWAIPTAVSAMMWKFLYDGQNGIIAKFFTEIGLIDSMGSLLTTDAGAMFAVVLADVWKTTPYIALLLLAGLQVIPRSLYEASAIDGAGKWKQFISVTLPLMKSSILVALLFRTLDAFRVFDLVYILTGGGPANATETISGYAYEIMFSQTNFGAGSAISVIVFICVAIISIIYVKLLGSDLLPEGSKK